MPLTETFLLSTNSDLTVEFSGVFQTVHFTDLSDGSQDFVLWLGSQNAARQLQTTLNPGVDNIILSVVDVLQLWGASVAYLAADAVQPTVANGFRYTADNAGTSNVSEPTWPLSIDSTVLDNDIVWRNVSQKHEVGEVKLATTQLGLDTALAGQPLSLPNTVLGGAINAVEIWIRLTNAVTTVGNNAGQPDIGCSFVSITETAI